MLMLIQANCGLPLLLNDSALDLKCYSDDHLGGVEPLTLTLAYLSFNF